MKSDIHSGVSPPASGGAGTIGEYRICSRQPGEPARGGAVLACARSPAASRSRQSSSETSPLTAESRVGVVGRVRERWVWPRLTINHLLDGLVNDVPTCHRVELRGLEPLPPTLPGGARSPQYCGRAHAGGSVERRSVAVASTGPRWVLCARVLELLTTTQDLYSEQPHRQLMNLYAQTGRYYAIPRLCKRLVTAWPTSVSNPTRKLPPRPRAARRRLIRLSAAARRGDTKCT